MRALFASILAVAISAGSWFPLPQARNAPTTTRKQKKAATYDGSWWLAADSDERSGFLEGAADCLTWVAHAKWLSHSPDKLEQEIDKHYKDHPKDRALPVTKVWQELLPRLPAAKPTPGGEVWTNPHTYFNGLWWRQVSEKQQLGFLEGNLWCMRTCVDRPKETYSQSAAYYADKIWDYILAHPEADDVAIADILARFRDKPKPK